MKHKEENDKGLKLLKKNEMECYDLIPGPASSNKT